MTDEPIVIDQIRARQGTSAPKLRYVLAGGLILAIIVFVGLMLWHP